MPTVPIETDRLLLRPLEPGDLGYATEAGRACAEWGFAELDLPCITAMINPENARSIRVAERLGFKPLRDDTLLGDPVVVHWLGGKA